MVCLSTAPSIGYLDRHTLVFIVRDVNLMNILLFIFRTYIFNDTPVPPQIVSLGSSFTFRDSVQVLRAGLEPILLLPFPFIPAPHRIYHTSQRKSQLWRKRKLSRSTQRPSRCPPTVIPKLFEEACLSVSWIAYQHRALLILRQYY